LNRWWDFLIKYFVPGILVIILIGDLSSEIRNPYEGYTWTSLILIGRDWLLLTLLAGIWISLRPWKTDNNKGQNRSDV